MKRLWTRLDRPDGLKMVRSAQQYGVSETARLVRIPPRACTWQSDVERSNGIIEFELLEVDRWQTRSELRQRRGNLVAKTTAWEYYFNRLRPNFPPTAPPSAGQEVFKSRWKRGGAYHQNRTPYQRMKRAGIPSKMAEQACFSRRDPFRDGR